MTKLDTKEKWFHVEVLTNQGLPPFHHNGFFGVTVSTFRTVYPLESHLPEQVKPGVVVKMNKETHEKFLASIERHIVRWRKDGEGRIRAATVYDTAYPGFYHVEGDEPVAKYIKMVEVQEGAATGAMYIMPDDGLTEAIASEESLAGDREDGQRKKRNKQAKKDKQPVQAGPSEGF